MPVKGDGQRGTSGGGDSHFQSRQVRLVPHLFGQGLIVEIEPELVERWAASSNNWSDKPESIPFGLALRPVDERTD